MKSILDEYNEISEDEFLKSQKQSIFILSLHIGGNRYVNLDKNLTTIHGVWNLSMFGDEKFDIENRYQNLTNNSGLIIEVDPANFKHIGCFVERPNGQLCQVQESICCYKGEYDFNEIGSRASQLRLEEKIQNEEVEESQVDALLNKFHEERNQFIKEKGLQPREINCSSSDLI